MAENKRLGKGLGDILKDYNLLDDVENLQKKPSEEQTTIRIDSIASNPYQPRIHFDQEKLEELASSIKMHGVLTPILLREIKAGKYQLVAGERRLKASKLAGLEEIPAVIADFNDDQMLEIALIENIQRENLNIVEEAKGYRQMIEMLGYNQQIIARRVGKSRSYVANILRCLLLPTQVQNKVLKRKLSLGQVKPLIGLPEKEVLELAARIEQEKWNARRIENIVKYQYRNDDYQDWQKCLLEFFKQYNCEVVFTKNSFKIKYKDYYDIEPAITQIIKKKITK